MGKKFIELTLMDGNKTYIRKDYIWRLEKEKDENSTWICSIGRWDGQINVKETVESILEKLNE